jgi:hypothetical protein
MIVDWPRRRPGLVFAALALLLLGSLFPRGTMPVGNGGRITIALCSADGGQRSVALDLGRESKPVQHSGSANCWGVFAGFALAPTALPLPVPPAAWPEQAPRPPRLVSLPQRFHFDPNAPPQAPPLLAS